jgi:hypothetical protein
MKNLYTFDEHLNEASSAFKHAVQQALQAAGYNLKQSEVKVGAKKVRGMGTKITLNGEMIGFDDNVPEMIASFTKSIQEDPEKYGLKESLNEKVMGYKQAYAFTKKLNDDALLQDLIYVADKIHDKMGTDDIVNQWLLKVITYGNKHKDMWTEALDEAAPKMTHHADVDVVAELITGLGSLGRRHTGSGITKDVTKAIKVLQSLRDNIKREA